MNYDWIPKTMKTISDGINEILNNDKTIGFLLVIILAHYVARLANAEGEVVTGILEWYKMALSGVFGAIMGYSIAKR